MHLNTDVIVRNNLIEEIKMFEKDRIENDTINKDKYKELYKLVDNIPDGEIITESDDKCQQ